MAHPIQLILTRQLAGYLNVPVFLVGPLGDLLFYNEPAEDILGRRFKETGLMPAAKWAMAFTREDEAGGPIPPSELPIMITLTKRRPSYKRLYIRGLNEIRQHIEAECIPITGPQNEFLGATAFFWEIPE